MNRKNLALVAIALFTLISCARFQAVVSGIDSFEEISRDEVMEIAEAYLTHEWKPSKKNIFHGLDKDGVRVDTPDIDAPLESVRPGWWIPDRINVGLPYMWGGFCSIEEFDKGIREGKYAGDIYSQYKRNSLGRARSKYAVGVDCSGFVSRCWKLPYHYSTRRLSQIAYSLPDVNEMKAGDILNKFNAHVFLFKEFKDEEKTIVTVYHATDHKVKQEPFLVRELIKEGFKPYRYKNIVD